MRIMGLDIGTKNIGVAVSDETCTLAQSREVIRRKSIEQVVSRIKELLEKFKVEEIVVGLPINMNGTEGEKAAESRKWADMLKEKLAVSVYLWDERLSTREAENIMISGNVSRKKRKVSIDKLAAQIILQGYLDSLKRE
ncbi:MAG: Holliday junction resolvase RuvX [Candidatus Omnitrophota bacterium]